jgi:hypothetical protein
MAGRSLVKEEVELNPFGAIFCTTLCPGIVWLEWLKVLYSTTEFIILFKILF